MAEVGEVAGQETVNVADSAQLSQQDSSLAEPEHNIMDPSVSSTSLEVTTKEDKVIQDQSGSDPLGEQDMDTHQEIPVEINGELNGNLEEHGAISETIEQKTPEDHGVPPEQVLPQDSHTGEDSSSLMVINMTNVVTPQLGVESEVARLSPTPLDGQPSIEEPVPLEPQPVQAEVQSEPQPGTDAITGPSPEEQVINEEVEPVQKEPPPAEDSGLSDPQTEEPAVSETTDDKPQPSQMESAGDPGNLVDLGPEEPGLSEFTDTQPQSDKVEDAIEPQEATEAFATENQPPSEEAPTDTQPQDEIKLLNLESVGDVEPESSQSSPGEDYERIDMKELENAGLVPEAEAATPAEGVKEELVPLDLDTSDSGAVIVEPPTPESQESEIQDTSDNIDKEDEHIAVIKDEAVPSETIYSAPEPHTMGLNDLDDWSMNLDNSNNTAPASQLTEETSNASPMEDIDAPFLEDEMGGTPDTIKDDLDLVPTPDTSEELKATDASSLVDSLEIDSPQPIVQPDVAPISATADSILEQEPSVPAPAEVTTTSPEAADEPETAMPGRPEPLQLMGADNGLPDIAEEPESPGSGAPSPVSQTGSGRRPLQMPTPSSEEEEVPSFRKTEFVEEEISHVAHVTVKTQPKMADVMAETNWVNVVYFLLAALAAVLMGCLFEGGISFLWILLALSLLSIVLFWRLKL